MEEECPICYLFAESTGYQTCLQCIYRICGDCAIQCCSCPFCRLQYPFNDARLFPHLNHSEMKYILARFMLAWLFFTILLLLSNPSV